jgi:hypothetical protein
MHWSSTQPIVARVSAAEQSLRDLGLSENEVRMIAAKSYERDVRVHVEYMKQETADSMFFAALMAVCAWRHISGHITIGMDYVPGVARFLIHCRDTGGPFDFLTWFEFDESAEAAFDEMLTRLRATEEWRYVEREVDVRLVRAEG